MCPPSHPCHTITWCTHPYRAHKTGTQLPSRKQRGSQCNQKHQQQGSQSNRAMRCPQLLPNWWQRLWLHQSSIWLQVWSWQCDAAWLLSNASPGCCDPGMICGQLRDKALPMHALPLSSLYSCACIAPESRLQTQQLPASLPAG